MTAAHFGSIAMRPKMLFAVAMFACLWTTEARLIACSCIGPQPPCQATWQAHAVFVGQVVGITDVQPAQKPEPSTALFDRRRVSFKVTEIFRGDVGASVIIRTGFGGGDCGYAFQVGSSYLVYAHQIPTGELTTGICSRTRPLSEAVDDLTYLRGRARQPGSLGTIQGVAKYQTPSQEYVRFEDWPPYGGGRVTIEATDPGRKDRYDAKTGPDGKYAVRVPVGKYRATLNPREGLYSTGSFMPVEILDVRGCSEANFVVKPDGRISGRVLDVDGRPVPALSVEILAASAVTNPRFSSSERVRTDAGGAFEFSKLAPGTYALGLTLNREPRSESNAIWFSRPAENEPQLLSIEPEERAWFGEAQLAASVKLASVHGVVALPDGKPAAGARVYVLTAPNFGIAAGPVAVDADGGFSFTVVAGRTYRLSAELFAEPGAQAVRLRQAQSEPFVAAAGTMSPFALRIQ